MAGTNTLISGANRLTNLALAGKSVAAIRREYGTMLNVPAGATVTVNGIAVGDTQRIVDGEEIVFAKPLGQKGL